MKEMWILVRKDGSVTQFIQENSDKPLAEYDSRVDDYYNNVADSIAQFVERHGYTPFGEKGA